MNEGIDMREYGRLEAEVAQLTKDMKFLKETVEAMRDMMQESKGGWKVIMMLSGISGSIGAVLSWLVTHFPVK